MVDTPWIVLCVFWVGVDLGAANQLEGSSCLAKCRYDLCGKTAHECTIIRWRQRQNKVADASIRKRLDTPACFVRRSSELYGTKGHRLLNLRRVTSDFLTDCVEMFPHLLRFLGVTVAHEEIP